jgi:GMP synthase-like glutamine amidotransferase
VRLLVVQHLYCEHPGSFSDVIGERNVDVVTVELDEGGTLPPPADVDAVLVMGGPMSAGDDDDHPWLAAERAFIRDAVHAGIPVLGACLGAQLLAASLDAAVYPAPAGPEVGLAPVDVTEAGRTDPVFSGLGPSFVACHWHGDTYDLPDGAELMASTPQCRNQAFRVGDTAYGVQFHVEVTADQIAEWRQVPSYVAALEAVMDPDAAQAFLAETEASVRDLAATARQLIWAWLDVAEAAAAKRRGGDARAVAATGADG